MSVKVSASIVVFRNSLEVVAAAVQSFLESYPEGILTWLTIHREIRWVPISGMRKEYSIFLITETSDSALLTTLR